MGAKVEVRFNGTEIARGDIRHTSPFEYTLTAPVLLSGGTLDITLTNATAADGTSARSLWVDYIALGELVMRPSDSRVVFDAGDGAAAYDGIDLSRPAERMTRNGALRFTVPAATASADVAAAGVYIDAIRGSDSNAGTFGSPWQTLKPLRSIALPAGHGIYLRCDSVFADTLALTASHIQDGTEIAGYGPECAIRKATITGADRFNGGWSKSGQLWSRALPASTPKITQLFINGQPQRLAQWPNTGPTPSLDQGAVASSAGFSQTNSASAVALRSLEASALAGKDLSNATVQLRTKPWLVETRKIKSASNGSFALDRATDRLLPAGKPFLLQDKLWMLDSPGEYFHDTQAQRIYVMAPTESANQDFNALQIEGTTREVALSVDGRAEIRIKNIAVVAAGSTGLRLFNTPRAKVSDVRAINNGIHGIRVSQWPIPATPTAAEGVVISDSLVQGSGHSGIDAGVSNSTQVRRTRVFQTGVAPHHQSGVFAAIATGPGGHVEDNEVEDSGYLGIMFSSIGGSQVKNNQVSGVCRRLIDCGGIYTWTGREQAARAGGAVVSGNRVIGNADSPLTDVPAYEDIQVGIYIDDYSHGVTVDDNLVTELPIGVLVHNASKITVSRNRLWLNSRASIWVTRDDVAGPPMTGNVYHGNTLVPKLQAQALKGDMPSFGVAQAFWFWNTVEGEASLGPGKNHFYANNVLQLFGQVAAHAWIRNPQGDRRANTLGWQALNPDPQTVRQPARFEVIMPQLGDEMVNNGSFGAGLQNWLIYRSPTSSGGTNQWQASKSSCLGACVDFSASHPGDLLGSQPFVLKPGIPYVYSWIATMPTTSPATVAAPYISRDTTPWDSMADNRGFVTTSTRQAAAGETLRYSAYFVPKAAAPTRVNQMMETLGSRVTFDEISVREVLGYAKPAAGELVAVAIGSKDRAEAFDCQDFGWPANCAATGLEGQSIRFPLTVAARSEQFLLRTDTAFRR